MKSKKIVKFLTLLHFLTKQIFVSSRSVEDQDELDWVFEPLSKGDDILVPANSPKKLNLQRDSFRLIPNNNFGPLGHALLQNVLDSNILPGALGFAGVNWPKTTRADQLSFFVIIIEPWNAQSVVQTLLTTRPNLATWHNLIFSFAFA